MKLITKTVVTAINLTETEIDVLEQARKILLEIGDSLEFNLSIDWDNFSGAIDFINDILNDRLEDVSIIQPIKEGE